MSTSVAILDAAEARIQAAGYHGFSFRDLAEDVGVKSASVHHHFPTKEALVAALIDRYAKRFEEMAVAAAPGPDRLRVMVDAFRATYRDGGRMCLCGVIAAESQGAPDTVVASARRFFDMATRLLAEGFAGDAAVARARGAAILARLEGALILARAAGDIAAFDAAMSDLTA